MGELARLEVSDGVGTIRLDRPKMNAINAQMQDELTIVAQEADARDDVAAVVVFGGERVFAAGADVKEMATMSYADMARRAHVLQQFTRDIAAIGKPTISAITGFALGGGCELAMMADFIIASDKARFGQPEIKLGVLPGMGGSQRLTRAVGKAKAMDLVLTGRMMDAAEAERAGLVARIAPHDSLLDEALAAARTIAGMAPLAALANKEAVEAAFETTLEAGIKYERRLFHMIAGTADKAEGMAAFIEKRDPVWQGK